MRNKIFSLFIIMEEILPSSYQSLRKLCDHGMPSSSYTKTILYHEYWMLLAIMMKVIIQVWVTFSLRSRNAFKESHT